MPEQKYKSSPITEVVRIPGKFLIRALNEASNAGFSTEDFLRQFDLGLAELKMPGSLILVSDFATVISRLIEESGIPALGLKAGLGEQIADYGVYGTAMQCAASLRQALDFSIQYQDIIGPIVRLKYAQSGGELVMFAEEQGVSGAAALYELEHTFTIMLSLVNTVGSVERICFVHDDSGCGDLYREQFGCEVRFAQPRNEMWVSVEHIDDPMPQSDPEMFELCRRQCDATYRNLMQSGSLPEQVRRLMMSSSGIFPSEEKIAESLGMSARSLRRQLAAEGMAYRTMLDECRISLAQEYLNQSKHSIAEITDKVGYATVQSFSRAFKRITGETPGAYRESVQLG